eukprot:jgi/Ulvmu1/105/UM001_0109.1
MLRRLAFGIGPVEIVSGLSGAVTVLSNVVNQFHTHQAAMGGDCCGVDKGVAAMTVEDVNGVTKGTTTKSDDAFVAEKQPFYAKRIELFEKYLQREQERLEAAKAAAVPIKVVLPDGSEKEAIKGATTPMDIAKGISNSLGKKVVSAHVDGKEWDINRPLIGDCALKLFSANDEEGMDTFWHSSAHVLGQALEQLYGVDLTIGPVIEEGFYYDCFMGEGRGTLSQDEWPKIVAKMEAIAKEAQPFQRVEVTQEEAKNMFQENRFKLEILDENVAPGAVISLYRCGPMVDLCRGPHLPNTSALKAQAVTNASRAFWRGDTAKEGLQRVYGITYPDKKQLAVYQRRIEEAKKRDHRVVGTQQDLFFFHQLSPGSCFFMPHGARIYHELVAFMRDKYWEYEYEEVVTPNIFNVDLWRTSGHADHYKENMFFIDIEKAEFGLKPMNCPAHCLMFGARKRSYRELPMRLADFGVLHRNEFSGALHGLTRVRRFQQDDAHIFCMPEHVKGEVSSFLKMLGEVYEVFGLEYSLALSTRPEGYLGELELWDKAEKALEESLNECGLDWKLDPGEGAFYGPKIDITVYDALKRKFQCATVQLDFQLPIRFGLQYWDEEQQPQRPVIVHRAILGSVERMYAILTEHYAQKWPLWLSPRQVMVVPISAAAYDYASTVRTELRNARFHVEVDMRDQKMQKKIREAQLAQFNYILVVGEAERAAGTVNVRTRDNAVHGEHRLQAVIAAMTAERAQRALTGNFGAADEAAAAAEPAAKADS